MTTQLRLWARALCGDVSGNGVICPGPGHSARDRSLSVTTCAMAPNGFLVNSFAGDDPLVCLDYVRARLGLSPFRPGQASKVAPQRERKPADEARRASDNREAALNIWRRVPSIRAEQSSRIICARATSNCRTRPRKSIRFHAACPFNSERFPAMVCLVRNIVTNEPQGIHRTALAPDGTAVKRNGKTFRMTRPGQGWRHQARSRRGHDTRPLHRRRRRDVSRRATNGL